MDNQLEIFPSGKHSGKWMHLPDSQVVFLKEQLMQRGNLPFSFYNKDTIDELFLCTHCREPLLSPQVHVGCGNTFCMECIYQREKCPKECSEGGTIPTPAVLNVVLGRLKVFELYFGHNTI